MKEFPMADAQPPRGFSRRRAILTGAGLVAAGAAGGLITQLAEGGGLLGAAKDNPKVPVMVHLRDARAGQFDVFFGDVKVEIVDANFAAKLVQAAAVSQ
jgi:hypothetical protein